MTLTFETLNVHRDGAVLFADIAAPSMNLLGTELLRDLGSLIQEAEADDGCRVLVFASNDPDYFIAHVDVTRISEYREVVAKLTGEPSIAMLLRYLSASHLVTIAQIEVACAALGASSRWRATCASRRGSRRSSVSRKKGSAWFPAEGAFST